MSQSSDTESDVEVVTDADCSANTRQTRSTRASAVAAVALADAARRMAAASQSSSAVSSSPPERHPLLYRVDSPSCERVLLSSLYEDPSSQTFGRLGRDVEIHISESLSRAHLDQPIQFELRAARNFRRGDKISFWGGVLANGSEVMAHGSSHARSMPGSFKVLDGLPFARMLQRPIPHTEEGLRGLLARGVEPLMPTASAGGYTDEDVAAFHASPVGYLANTGRASDQNVAIGCVEVGSLTSVPVFIASREITAGEPLICPYNNRESRNWSSGFKSICAHPASSEEPA